MARKTASAKKATSARSMTDEHKAALAEGRSRARAVRRYLEVLEHHRPVAAEAPSGLAGLF